MLKLQKILWKFLYSYYQYNRDTFCIGICGNSNIPVAQKSAQSTQTGQARNGWMAQTRCQPDPDRRNHPDHRHIQHEWRRCLASATGCSPL